MSDISQESQFTGKLLLSFKMLFFSSDMSYLETRGLVHTIRACIGTLGLACDQGWSFLATNSQLHPLLPMLVALCVWDNLLGNWGFAHLHPP